MRAVQFWVLMAASIVVTCLYFKEISLSRSVIRSQHTLTDDRETADTAPLYEKRWQSLAVGIYQASAQDPAMVNLLKSEGIRVHQMPPGSVNPAGGRMPPNASTKPLASPSQPGHPATP